MPDRPLLSATLIAKDEAQNVERCFNSLWPFCDQIVLVDTGSTDATVSTAKRYAAERKQARKLKVAQFAWKDDFAAARQKADDLATGEWLVWADLDDSITGLDRLREMARDATEDVRAFFVRYKYAADPTGNAISELWRERVVRNDGTKWTGRLHEHKLFVGAGQIVKVDPSVAEWVHHRNHEERTGERNLRILHRWLDDEPDDPRVMSSLAMEYMGCEQYQEAADMYERYLERPGEQLDRRCQAARHRCQMLLMLNRPGDAKQAAFRALEEEWLWADTHLSLAEAEQTLGNPAAAFLHAQEALRIGQPDTLLIVNPLQYTAHPHALMAVCLAQQGQYEDAIRECERALEIAPSYGLAAEQLPRYRSGAQRHHALGAFLNCAQMLVEHGELVKARALLDSAPWFIADEPQLIRQRGDVARLLTERLASSASGETDEAADLFVKRHAEAA